MTGEGGLGGRVIAWFSRGAASAVACKLAIADHGDDVVVACIGLSTEHPDSARFAEDCQEWFGQEIVYLHSEKYQDTWGVWQDRRFLVGPQGAPCTGELKRRVRHLFQLPDDRHVFGYTVDEAHRAKRIQDSEPGIELVTPLLDRGLTKDDCYEIVERAGIEIPAMYRMGYDNNNCIGCPKGGMGYWNAIRVDFPLTFLRMAALERDIGHAVLSEEDPDQPGRKKRPVWLDELDPDRGDFHRDQPRSCSFMCDPTADELAR